ncbi:hypothetical protein IPJ72_02280 [Candidatus Peregrinibacteria bacterium]|nr:MAG: hypothetical protein IPJ72_02280 [Candidatus Peregrinibacteria bacterium]
MVDPFFNRSVQVWLAQTSPPPIFGGTGGQNDPQDGVTRIGEALSNTGITENASLAALIIKYVNFALPYLALAAFLGFVYAGFLYVTAYGGEDQVNKAKR